MRIAIHSLRREVRVAMLVALVAGVGALGIHYGLREAGIGLYAMAAAIAAAFFLVIVRPARIPRDAVLTIKLAGGCCVITNCVAAAGVTVLALVIALNVPLETPSV